MPFPTIGALAQRVYDQIGQAQKAGDDEAGGWTLAGLTGALLDPIQWVSDALTPDGDDPPAGKLLDPDETPSVLIRWLGQWHGVRTTIGAAEAVQRDEVKTAAGRKRGRTTSMIADVKRTLTGDQFVAVVQFVDGNRWRAAFRTLPAETPDAAATLRAAMGQKPYGVILEHAESDSPLWDEIPAGVTWDDIAPGVTWDDVTIDDVEA